ncbi:Mariner Mos1 transposase [Anthophora quadrimaculata]
MKLCDIWKDSPMHLRFLQSVTNPNLLEPNKPHLREALLFCFYLKKSTAEAHRMLIEAYGEACMSESSCREWFRRFKDRDFDVEKKECSGRPKLFEDEEMKAILDADVEESNKIITGERYRLQLMRFSRALKDKPLQYAEKHDKVILQHDNVMRPVKNYLETLKWEVLPHPLYIPDIFLSDYHLFRAMTHGVSSQHSTSYEDTKNWIDSWIFSKEEQFFRCGIRMLPKRWAKVVGSDGNYFE